MRKFLALLLAVLLFSPVAALAATSVEELQKQIDELMEELEDLNDRVDQNERKTALDRISWYGDFRNMAHSVHYQDVTFNPGVNVDFDNFFGNVLSGNFGAVNVITPTGFDPSLAATPIDNILVGMAMTQPTLFTELMQAMATNTPAGVGRFPFLPEAQSKTYDIDNNILYTTRLRLGMKASVFDNVDFAGRLLMYKNWGDSTAVKVFDSWDTFTMDGTMSGNTTGDWLHVERAYFDWKDIGGSNFYLSIGRRPSSYGPPSQYRENELRGGTPTGHLVHFNFDGITAGYKLGKLTGIEGQTIRFCYGQGFESEFGNGELFNTVNTDDVHLGGINFDVLNDGTNFLQFTLFRAQDVTDGFKGLIAFPTPFAQFFAPVMYQDLQNFPTFNFVTRVQPAENIGDINLGAIGFTREEMNGVNWFISGAWTMAEPNGKAGMFGGLLSDAVYQVDVDPATGNISMDVVGATSDDDEHGFSVYTGVQIPAPMGKLGLEYNYGSQYWTPFTQAQDDIIGSKLATRGHVGEAYYIFDVNPNMFIKVGGIYYDYEYTNSGSPVGAPQKVDDVESGKAVSLLPVVDTAWDAYANITVKF